VGEVLYAATQFRTRTAREESRGRRSIVLLVDPDPAALAAMEQALRDGGFVTATAFDGAGALAASHRVGTLDLLVTNVQATQMHAVELADVLRRQHPGLQVLYMTTSEDELFGERLLLSGDDDVIEKPFSGGELVDAVSSLLR
jgi:two-component system, cell cycle sensor histidine kinase and response regulator CckA